MSKAIKDAIDMFHDAERDGDKLRMQSSVEHLSFLADIQRITATPLNIIVSETGLDRRARQRPEGETTHNTSIELER